MGYKIIGVIEDHHQGKSMFEKYPLLGNLANLEKPIVAGGVQDVLIAAPSLDESHC